MRHLPISGFPIIEPEEADPELAQRFAEAQQTVNLPFVPSWAQIGTASPDALNTYLEIYQAFQQNISLPQALVPMILYAIATARNCTYCSLR